MIIEMVKTNIRHAIDMQNMRTCAVTLKAVPKPLTIIANTSVALPWFDGTLAPVRGEELP